MSRSAAIPSQRESFSDSFARLVEELTEKLQAGEPIDVEAFLQAHPEDAEPLRRLLPALFLLAEISRSGDGPAPGAAPANELGQLGDFRIIREVGRGGMGVVYEAEQISLGRRVALKVLPFAATMDPRHLQRFQNEARAAASLHHEHIVPVHAVGCERTVHFYAMQFIEGESLAELIAARDSASRGRQPSGAGAEPDTRAIAAASTEAGPHGAPYFRRIAAWGTQAAEALEHAHALGIVHRDVKPANLIVDVQSKLWVTDFGLARTVTDAGLTMSGDLLGTLRYMSPEQALAKHGLVDHRTDVYSLGATLYELLTGSPAVEGHDRQEILRRIADEDPGPIGRGVPADLETIVLKALAKEPAERYATAKELANDLRRFQEDRPIVAKRPTLPQRLRKWGQRYRHLAGATALFLAVVVVGLAVSAFLLWREKEQTREALAEARANYTRAEAQRQRAETNFREAFSSIEHLLAAFDPNRSQGTVTFAELRQYQTEEALQFLSTFCEQSSDDPAIRLQQGVAYVHTGRVYQVRAERDKAQQAFRQAIAVFGRLVEDFPEDPKYPRELGWALYILAADLYAGGRLQEGNTYFGQSIGVWREAIRKHPEDVDSLTQLASFLCRWFDPNLCDPRGAVELARKAVALAPQLPNTWLALGVASYRSGEWTAAAAALQKAFQLQAGEWTRAQIACFLAMAQWRCARPVEARESYQQAVQLMEGNFDARDLALRAETAAVLGIPVPPTPKAKEESPRKD
jgi:serine/threonine protein kinase/Flp pilus assembly protein TadD